VPEIDEKGRLGHAVALEYQRYLAMTESIAPYEAPPPQNYLNAAGFVDIHPFWRRRLELQPEVFGGRPNVIGRPTIQHPRIPLHPMITQAQQIITPNEISRKLISSYARFAARKSQAQAKEGWTFKSVKVYRVIHHIPTVGWYVNKYSPTDPALYWPYYMGNYDVAGTLLDGDPSYGESRDPYLYWMLPILRSNPSDPASEIRDYCRLHAGDSHWVRPPGMEKESDWVDPRE
jgi:hypothetical protein